jgi:hypothetical protein
MVRRKVSRTRTKPQPEQDQWPADKVERQPIGNLLPYARNARQHSDAQIAQIAASIKEWGWTVPVLVDEHNTLIAGHGRILAAYQLGLPDVPTIVARGWSDAKVRAYRIADNKLALNSSWDDELLSLEFEDLIGGFDLSLTGFAPVDIETLMRGAEPPGEFSEYDSNIATEHACPKCGFKWSGKVSSSRHAVPDTNDGGDRGDTAER